MRKQIIRDYGNAYELITPPDVAVKRKRKNKRSNSSNTKRKREIAAQAIRSYHTDDVLLAAQRFIQEREEEWVNFSRVSQHLYERFYKLKPRHLGESGKRYKSLVKLLQDYPERFEIQPDKQKTGSYWIQVADKCERDG